MISFSASSSVMFTGLTLLTPTLAVEPMPKGFPTPLVATTSALANTLAAKAVTIFF